MLSIIPGRPGGLAVTLECHLVLLMVLVRELESRRGGILN